MTSRTFFILPLGHSEDLADQKQAMVLTEDVKEHAPPAMQELAGLQLHAARQHIELIERFGRCVAEDFLHCALLELRRLAVGLALRCLIRTLAQLTCVTRFPHRNGPLGRTDTEAEAAWRKVRTLCDAGKADSLQETGGRPFG